MGGSSAVRPVILSGGAGTRLWPLSRAAFPKQFISIDSDQSLFQQTVALLSGGLFLDPLVVCNHEHRFVVSDQLEEIGTSPELIVLEPEGRNTGPAVTVGALAALELDPEALVLAVPSDTLYGNSDAVLAGIAAGLEAAAAGNMIVFGVPPQSPETGFGYVNPGVRLAKSIDVLTINAFVEKPDAETAAAFVRSGEYLWNSGMFLFSAAALVAELEILEPDFLGATRAALKGAQDDLGFRRLDSDLFAGARAISFDYLVMERTERGAVVPLKSDWTDMGSWAAVARKAVSDESGNVFVGDVVANDVNACYLRSEKPLIAAVGISNTLVVATDDVVLVADPSRSQDVRQLVEGLAAEGRSEHITHTSVYRPWGYYQVLDDADGFRVKRLFIKPGAAVSLQRHMHRSEHWIVVRGEARVTRGDDVFTLTADQSTYIPAQTLHRLENASDQPLELIEVQTGTLLSEDDIERVSDSYGRALDETSGA